MNTVQIHITGTPTPCPVCVSPRRKLDGPLISQRVANVGDFEWPRCRECFLYHCYPMSHIVGEFDLFYNSENFEHKPCDYRQLVNDPWVLLLFTLLREEKATTVKRLLDIGCGRGQYLIVAHDLDWNNQRFHLSCYK